MNRSTVLIVGLFSLAVFAILCVRHNVTAIQDDITLRAEEVLSEAKAGWADISLSGRDLSIGGIAPNPAARDQAVTALVALRGLRKLSDQTVLSSQAARTPSTTPSTPRSGTEPDNSPVATAKARQSDGPYWFSITRSDQGATLEGLMPDERSREALATLARRRIGNGEVRDLLDIQSGSPPGWRDVTAAALVLSGALVEGEVAVRGRSVFVRGLTSTDTSSEEIRIGLATALPQGYSGQAEVQPAHKLNELLRTAPGAASRLADRRASARREAAAEAGAFDPPIAPEPGSELAPGAEPDTEPDAESLPEPTADVIAAADPSADTSRSDAFCQREFDALLSRERILFETASHIIDSQSRELLDELAAVANRCPTARIEIGGHTDDQGAQSNNLALSQRRAEAVMQYLATRNVSVSRMTAQGYGEERPLVRNRTAEHRARNRRIELKIIEDD